MIDHWVLSKNFSWEQDLSESLKGLMIENCANFQSRFGFQFSAAINHHWDLRICEPARHLYFHFLIVIPNSIRVFDVQFYSSSHITHDHSDREHVDLVLVLGIRFYFAKLRRLELPIFAYSGWRCLCLVNSLFHSDGIKVSQHELLTVTKNDCFWINSSMHRIGIMQSFQHLDKSSVHCQKFRLRPIITVCSPLFTLLLEMVTYKNYRVIKI